MLGGIEVAVRLAEERSLAGASVLERGEADARGHALARHRPVPSDRLDGSTNVFATTPSFIESDGWEVEHEFLATLSRRPSGLRCRCSENARYPDQHLVADRVREPVVDQLEVVEVDQPDRQRGAVLPRAGKQDRQLGVDMAPVAQAGQRVAQRQLPEPFALTPRLGGLKHRLERARICLALGGPQCRVLRVKFNVLLVGAFEESLSGVETRSLLEGLDTDGNHAAPSTQLDAAIESRAGVGHVPLKALRARGGVERFSKALDRPQVKVRII